MDKQLPYILADCDGTITDRHSEINPQTIQDILAYQKKSKNRFSFITGRLDITNKELVKQLKVTLPIVSCNGALITDPVSWKVLHAEYIEKDVVAKILREAEKNKMNLLLYEPGAIVGIEKSNRVQYWLEKKEQLKKKKFDFELKIYPTVDELAEDIMNEKIKVVEIIIVAEIKDQVKKMRKMLELFQQEITYVQATSISFNITKFGVDKAFGLKKWAELINTHARDVVIFGDNYNDLTMTKEVNYSYAVDNAVLELKKVAFKTIGSVENNGVGEKLKEIMKYEF